MGPIAYSLCQKPFIGTLMFVTNVCGFPPLIYEEPLLSTGTSKEFNVPVDKAYFLDFDILASRNASCPSLDNPEVQQTALDFLVSFQVYVTKKSDQSVVLDKTFQSSFAVSTAVETRTLPNARWNNTVAKIDLVRGDYVASVKMLNQSNCFAGYQITKSSYSLVAGHGK